MTRAPGDRGRQSVNAGNRTLDRRRPVTRGLLALVVPALIGVCAPAPTPAPRPVPMPPDAPTPVPVPAPRPAEGVVGGGAGDLRYRVVGDGPDTTLVPLGAWLEDSLVPLGGRHTLIFYDPRHRGGSHALVDSSAATFDGDVADVDAVRAFFDVSRVALIGYDYYAGVVAAWAAAHPTRVTRVVLLSPMEPADSLASDWVPASRLARLDTAAARSLVQWRAAGRDTTDPVAYCEAFWRVNAPLFMHDTARAGRLQPAWCSWPNEAPPRIAAAARPAVESLGPEANLGARATGLAAPVLVIHGRDDLVANPAGAEEWARRSGDARLLWLRNTGHMPHLESAATLRSALDFFLSGHWPPLAVLPDG